MSAPVFLRCPEVAGLGYAHGFGTDLSHGRVPADASMATQVHGTELVRAPVAPGTRADALFTTEPGHAVAILTADCVPILLVDTKRRAVAAAHAGWRGSVNGIAARVVDRLCGATASVATDWVAVVGPHIGVCCYEVDAPVLEALPSLEPGLLRKSPRPGRAFLDLFVLNRTGLQAAGVERVLRVPGCARCDRRFASFRRDRTERRMVSYVRLPAAQAAGLAPASR